MNNAVIKTENLTKEYDGFVAVRNLNMEVYRGEVFGLLGPNGAGKTTTILMLLGLVPPTSGNAWIDGYSIGRAPMKVRSRVSLVPENLGLYDELTARQNLYFTAELNGITGIEKKKRVEELLRKVGLKEWGDVKVGKFSKGMKQRLGMADALIKKPKVLMLDEPTAGIDPEGVEQILTMISSLSRDEGVTILLSSHLLHQVQRVCDRVGIMSKGELVAVGSIESLAKGEYTVEAEFDRLDSRFIDNLSTIEGVSEILRKKNRVFIKAEKDVRREISALASEGGYLILEIRLKAPSLDELYMKYFGG
ncbi:MAG: ABC transporter ATP-binding protein [Candidatus Bathyarchaeia archaeon]